MDVRKLVEGGNYIISHRLNKWSNREEYVATLSKIDKYTGWHDMVLRSPANGGPQRALPLHQQNKKIRVASRSILRPETLMASSPKKKGKKNANLQKELEGLVIMLQSFNITAGVDVETGGIIIDPEDVPRFRRLLNRMFSKQLGM